MLVCSKGKLMGLTEQQDVQLFFLTAIPQQTGLQLHICLGKDNEETLSENKELVTSQRLAHVVAQRFPCKQYSQQSIKLHFTVQGAFKY